MKRNYSKLIICQSFCAISVILIHCGRLVENDMVHFFLKNTFARLAVPLFIISTSYFFRKRILDDSKYPRKYFLKQCKCYLFWSLFYLPYGLFYLSSLNISRIYYPIALVFALGYSGVCYHLWYFPALFFSLSLSSFLKKICGYRSLLLLGGITFTLGATETYSAYLIGTKIGSYYSNVHSVLMTNRNGLLYSLVFVILGFLVADYENSPLFKEKLFSKLVCSAIMFGLECTIVFANQGDDKNFFITSLTTVLFLFTLLINGSEIKRNINWLRNYNRYLFFLHPMLLEVIRQYFTLHFDFSMNGLELFIVTLLSTIFVSWCLINLNKLVRKIMQTNLLLNIFTIRPEVKKNEHN